MTLPKWLPTAGLSTKDFIAPSSLRFGNSRVFGISGKYGAVSFLQILAPELSDEMLADFLNTENGIVVNLHVQAIEQTEAIKRVKRIISGAYANDTPLQPQSERSKRRRQWVGPRENHAGVKVPWCWSPPAVRFMPLFS